VHGGLYRFPDFAAECGPPPLFKCLDPPA